MIKIIFKFFIHLSKIFSRKNLIPFLEKKIEKIPSSNHVFNIGSGGQINTLLKKYSNKNKFKLTTFDIDKNQNPDIKGDICSYVFPKKKYIDVVIISEVLEHLHSPHLAIKNIKSILKKKGKLILTTPFIFPIHEKPYDYYRYTKYGLQFLLKDFTHLSIKENNSWTEAILVLWMRLIMDKKTISRLLAPFFIMIHIILFPLYYLIGKIIKSNFITTRYLVYAQL